MGCSCVLCGSEADIKIELPERGTGKVWERCREGRLEQGAGW